MAASKTTAAGRVVSSSRNCTSPPARAGRKAASHWPQVDGRGVGGWANGWMADGGGWRECGMQGPGQDSSRKARQGKERAARIMQNAKKMNAG
ncbi:hypothetical protein B7463_g3790, partial [Scytalidium lignicola]